MSLHALYGVGLGEPPIEVTVSASILRSERQLEVVEPEIQLHHPRGIGEVDSPLSPYRRARFSFPPRRRTYSTGWWQFGMQFPLSKWRLLLVTKLVGPLV